MSFHNRQSYRKKWHDYTAPCIYFITICTKNKQHYFWEIREGVMHANALGAYMTYQRCTIQQHYPHVIPGAFICMPDHMHGILMVWPRNTVGTQLFASTWWIHASEWCINKKTYECIDKRAYENAPLQCVSWSLGAIIRGFKIGVTKYARAHDIPFSWQWRYYDIIIKNRSMYYRVEQYIWDNPKKR